MFLKSEALFPSDGGGIPYAEMIIPSGNSNFTQYQESLEKLKPLKVDMFCADHYGYVTGREAENYIFRSIDAARENRAMVEAIYRRTGSIDATVTGAGGGGLRQLSGFSHRTGDLCRCLPSDGASHRRGAGGIGQDRVYHQKIC